MAQLSVAFALASLVGVVGSVTLVLARPAASKLASRPAALRVPDRPGEARAARELQEPMLRVRAGSYQPFYRARTDAPPIWVPAFWLDAAPVSRHSFATFLGHDPNWQRARVEPVFAEASYLSDWTAETLSDGDRAAPVVFVSWFAARAYCAWQGKRLPSVVEWEHAASLAGFSPQALSAPPKLWEWTLDFNSLPVDAGDSGGANLFCGAGARARDPRDYTAFLRYAFRSSLKAGYALKNLGFRCAREASE